MAHVKESERSLGNKDATSVLTETLGDNSCTGNENDSKTSNVSGEFYWYVTKRALFFFTFTIRFKARV